MGNDSVKLLAIRYVIGFFVLTIIMVAGFQKVNYRGKPFFILLLCGTLNPLVSQLLEFTAIGFTPTSQIAVFYSLIPVFIVLMSIPINHEFPKPRQVFFMIMTASGIILVNLPGGEIKGIGVLSIIMVLLATIAISLQRVFVRRVSSTFTAFEIIYVTTGMGAAGFSFFTLVKHAAQGNLSSFFDGLWTFEFIIPLLYIAICSCVIGFLLLTYAAARLPVAVSSSTSMLNAVIAVLVGVFILNETFRVIDVVGTCISFLGIIGMSFSYNASVSNRYTKSSQERIL